MAYNESLAERVRLNLASEAVTEKKMFGGLSFLIGGNMTVGIVGDDLLVRGPKEAHEQLLALPGVREMDFTGRPMKGWVFVAPSITADDLQLRDWVARGVTFSKSLPPKH